MLQLIQMVMLGFMRYVMQFLGHWLMAISGLIFRQVMSAGVTQPLTSFWRLPAIVPMR
jgi:hypothetical protein